MCRQIGWVLLLACWFGFESSRAGEEKRIEEEPVYQGKSRTEWIGDLKDPKTEIRLVAAKSLFVFGPKKQVISALTATLKKSEEVGLVVEAARTLGKFGPAAKESLPALRSAFQELKKPRGEMNRYLVKETRMAIAEALVLIDEHPDAKLAPILVEALKTDDADKRRDIVAKLGKLGPDAAQTTVPALIAVLIEMDKSLAQAPSSSSSRIPTEKLRAIRLETIKSLGRIGPAAKPALHVLSLALKKAAAEKEYIIEERAGVLDQPALRISYTTSGVSGKEMRLACAEALGHICPRGKGTIAGLRLALRDLDAGVRWAALCALLESGLDAKEVLPILRNVLKDEDADLRRVAEQALEVIGEKK